MVKNSVYKGLIIVVVICLSFVFVVSVSNVVTKDITDNETVFSEADFLLEVDLSGTVFHVGDTISGTATFTNRSGKDVTIVSNGAQPCTYLHRPYETNQHSEIMPKCSQILKAGDNISRVFNWPVNDGGTYVLYVHYGIEVNGVELRSALEDIIIEVN